MDERYDVAIVGCGGAGSATAWHLARRGRRVVAFDRFEPGHRRGSSHGTERIVRAAYADPVYVELAIESFARWRELESESGATLLTRTGGIDFGYPDELEEIATNCRAAGVPVELVDEHEAARRFPGFVLGGPVLFQPETSTVHAEEALAAMQRVAATRGATIHHGEQVVAVEPGDDGVTVVTDRRRVTADACVVTTGAWASATVPADVGLPEIIVTQEQVAYFRTARRDWPTFIHRGEPSVYGLPTPDGLVKAGEHYTGPVVDADTRDFTIEPTSWARLLEWVRDHLPGVDPVPVADTTCLYASSPTEDFVVDRVGRMVIGVGLGGHGFKFLPELGRRLADLADGIAAEANPFTLASSARVAGKSGHK